MKRPVFCLRTVRRIFDLCSTLTVLQHDCG